MASITETILAWRAGQLTGTQLMRSLVSHTHWIIPLSEAAATEVLANNEVPAGPVQSRCEGDKPAHVVVIR
jgi:hypothetical protein